MRKSRGGQNWVVARGHFSVDVSTIVRDVREEHRQAVDWLNEHTDEGINFFLVAIELWRIADSPPAPKFTTISRPNEWRRALRKGTQEGDLTDTKTKQLDFWQQFKEFAATNHPNLKLRTPRPQHWFDVSIGRSDCYLSLVVDSREDMVRCELYIPDSKDLYRTLFSCKEDIEKQLNISEPIEWMELPGKKASRIKATFGFRFRDTATWDAAFAWLTETVLRFKRVFTKDWQTRNNLQTAEAPGITVSPQS